MGIIYKRHAVLSAHEVRVALELRARAIGLVVDGESVIWGGTLCSTDLVMELGFERSLESDTGMGPAKGLSLMDVLCDATADDTIRRVLVEEKDQSAYHPKCPVCGKDNLTNKDPLSLSCPDCGWPKNPREGSPEGLLCVCCGKRTVEQRARTDGPGIKSRCMACGWEA